MSDNEDLNRLLRAYPRLSPDQQFLVRQRVMNEARVLRSKAFVGLFRRFCSWLGRRAAMARLHALDDRMLKDIGVSRGGIEAAVRGDPLHCVSPERAAAPHTPGRDLAA
jgi:uncharacterized protein YjiS (DUF1127 family)